MKFFAFIFLISIPYSSTSFSGQHCSGSGYISHPTDCSIYYQCSNGVYVRQTCPAGLNFNKVGSYCDWPANVHCDAAPEEPEPEPEPQPTSSTAKPQTTTKAPATTTTVRTTTKTPATTTVRTTTTTTTTLKPSPSFLITPEEFQSAATTKGGNPGPGYYQGFINSLPKAGITTRREAVLFLAHAVWETVGFIYTKEVYCQTNLQACANAYPNHAGGLPGKVYYGRGMLQLTWDYNYAAASQYLYGDSRLLQNPDVVGEDPGAGWATAAYYWWANVHARTETFGTTLKAINGALECHGGTHQENRYLRFMHYKDILQRLGETQPHDDDGWCTAW